MAYRLKSGITKTAIYNAVLLHDTGSVSLPPLRKCDFRKYRHSYWLEFYQDGYHWEVFFTQWDGRVVYSVTRYEYADDGSCLRYETLSFQSIPFEYLQEHDMLREVA